MIDTFHFVDIGKLLQYETLVIKNCYRTTFMPQAFAHTDLVCLILLFYPTTIRCIGLADGFGNERTVTVVR